VQGHLEASCIPVLAKQERPEEVAQGAPRSFLVVLEVTHRTRTWEVARKCQENFLSRPRRRCIGIRASSFLEGEARGFLEPSCASEQEPATSGVMASHGGKSAEEAKKALEHVGASSEGHALDSRTTAGRR